MQHITQYDGLYGEADARSNGDYLFSERLETRSHTFDWVIQPHTHAQLFQVFFLETGNVEFSEATQKRSLTGPVIMLIPPTALHGFVYTPDAKGRIITLSDALLHGLFPASSPLTPMLGSIQCLQPVEELYSAAVLEQLMAQIADELFGDQAEKRTMLLLNLQRFSSYCIGYGSSTKPHKTIQTALVSGIFANSSTRCGR